MGVQDDWRILIMHVAIFLKFWSSYEYLSDYLSEDISLNNWHIGSPNHVDY